jgi:hypothetical protein
MEVLLGCQMVEKAVSVDVVWWWVGRVGCVSVLPCVVLGRGTIFFIIVGII